MFTLANHFGYRVVEAGKKSPWDDPTAPAEHFACVVGPDGSELVITQIDAQADGRSAYPKGFHFGLFQDSREAVFAKHDELTAAGYAPGKIRDGFEVWGATWTAFYCPLGDGLEIEINYRTASKLLDGSGFEEGAGELVTPERSGGYSDHPADHFA